MQNATAGVRFAAQKRDDSSHFPQLRELQKSVTIRRCFCNSENHRKVPYGRLWCLCLGSCEAWLVPQIRLTLPNRRPNRLKVLFDSVDDSHPSFALLACCCLRGRNHGLAVRRLWRPRRPKVPRGGLGAGAFVRGQVRGGNFVFQFGVEISPTNLGLFLLFVECPSILRDEGKAALVQSFFAIRQEGGPIDKQITSLAKIFTQLIVHKEPKGLGVDVSRV